MSDFEKVWDYIRFGRRGYYVENEKNGREIVKTSSFVDTLWPEVDCFENQKFVMHTRGREAIKWLLGEEA